MSEVNGVFVSAITPRGKDGDIDVGAAFELVDFLCRAGVSGILLFGAAGEYPAATSEERNRLVYLAAKRSRAPVYAGAGSATLDGSLALARDAVEANAAGVLLPPPLFFRYRQDEIREFYRAFARGAGRSAPTYLYNIPAHASGIEAETAVALLDDGCFAGVADADGGGEMLSRVRAAGQSAFFAGHDGGIAEARWAGASACLSEAACAAPELIVSLDGAIAAGDRQRAGRLDGFLREFLVRAERLPPLAAVKAAIEVRGLKAGPPPAPLPREKQPEFEEFRAWFRDWLKRVSAEIEAGVRR